MTIRAIARSAGGFVRKEAVTAALMVVFFLCVGGSLWTSHRLITDPWLGCDRLPSLSGQAACMRDASSGLLWVAAPLGILVAVLMTVGMVNVLVPKKP